MNRVQIDGIWYHVELKKTLLGKEYIQLTKIESSKEKIQ